jgi:hypothetical protein
LAGREPGENIVTDNIVTDQEKAAARPVDESERWLEAGERWNRVLTSGQNMLDNLLLNFLDDEAENWARKVQLRKLAEKRKRKIHE